VEGLIARGSVGSWSHPVWRYRFSFCLHVSTGVGICGPKKPTDWRSPISSVNGLSNGSFVCVLHSNREDDIVVGLC
jgi:hypothetical protein